MIPVARPLLGAEEVRAVRDVLLSGNLAQGDRVAEFERRFARYIGRRHAVAVNSGTAALHLALLACNIRPGDEVVLPPLTFFSSASMVLACGGRPAFADIDEVTYTLHPDDARKAITAKAKAVMPVHLFGQCADMKPLLELAGDHGLCVVEDAAQAHGATYGRRRAGSFGDVSCFSFYATKNLTTGEGGMILTDDTEIAERCRLLRDHGQVAKYRHATMGYNYRMTEMAGAIGLVQLTRLPAFLRARRRNATLLQQNLNSVDGLVPPAEAPYGRHSWYQYVVRLTRGFPRPRSAFLASLQNAGIGARPSYPVPLHRQKALRGRARARPCPMAATVMPQLVELPVHPGLRRADVSRIARAVRAAAA